MGRPIGDTPAPRPGLNLSRLQVLQSLQLRGWACDYGLINPRRHTIIVEMFLTIRSPVFSELAFNLGDHEIAQLPASAS